MKKPWLFALILWALAGCARGEIRFSELLACNGIYEKGEAYEWVEIQNTENAPVSLAGVRLEYIRKGNRQVFVFPDDAALPNQGYGVVFCIENDLPPGKGEGWYAPLDLSRKGGTLLLTREEEILDRLDYSEQWGNISLGRVQGGNTWAYFDVPSPGSANGSGGFETRAEAPAFSLPGGFYSAGEMISLSAQPGAEIRYTLNGSEPTDHSSLYDGALTLNEGISCLRARAFLTDAIPSETVTQTYFVDTPAYSPVVSLVTDDAYLFSSRTGLLVPGNGKIKNYDQDWEYPISVEYFDREGRQLLCQGATFRVTGATSRAYGQKTLSLFARAAWGGSRFEFQPFENREEYTGYKSLTLRAAGTESFLTRFRDALLTSRAADLPILYQAAVPVTVYINGEYWGHYNLRERINKYMIAQFEGIEDEALIDGITIIKGRGEVQQGSRIEWDELISFCKKKDLNAPENLLWLEDRLDIESFFIHTAVEMIVGNTDIGNVRYYKVPGGKWKCALYDLDAGMENLLQGPIRFYHKTPKEDSALFYHEPFAALMQVPVMREKFLTLFGQALLRYLPRDLDAEIDRWEEALTPLMEDQIRRWPKPSPASLAVWRYEVRSLRKICAQRPEKALDMLCAVYHVSEQEKQKFFSAFYQAIQ